MKRYGADGSPPVRRGRQPYTSTALWPLSACRPSAANPSPLRPCAISSRLLRELMTLSITQRQAGGKFTRDEADELIRQLQDDAFVAGEPAAPRLSAAERALRGFSDADLAAELQRRGWVVMEP